MGVVRRRAVEKRRATMSSMLLCKIDAISSEVPASLLLLSDGYRWLGLAAGLRDISPCDRCIMSSLT